MKLGQRFKKLTTRIAPLALALGVFGCNQDTTPEQPPPPTPGSISQVGGAELLRAIEDAFQISDKLRNSPAILFAIGGNDFEPQSDPFLPEIDQIIDEDYQRFLTCMGPDFNPNDFRQPEPHPNRGHFRIQTTRCIPTHGPISYTRRTGVNPTAYTMSFKENIDDRNKTSTINGRIPNSQKSVRIEFQAGEDNFGKYKKWSVCKLEDLSGMAIQTIINDLPPNNNYPSDFEDHSQEEIDANPQLKFIDEIAKKHFEGKPVGSETCMITKELQDGPKTYKETTFKVSVTGIDVQMASEYRFWETTTEATFDDLDPAGNLSFYRSDNLFPSNSESHATNPINSKKLAKEGQEVSGKTYNKYLHEMSKFKAALDLDLAPEAPQSSSTEN